MVMWFVQKYIQQNTDKFQSIWWTGSSSSLNIVGSAIDSEAVVKLLRVSIDTALSFSNHAGIVVPKSLEGI